MLLALVQRRVHFRDLDDRAGRIVVDLVADELRDRSDTTRHEPVGPSRRKPTHKNRRIQEAFLMAESRPSRSQDQKKRRRPPVAAARARSIAIVFRGLFMAALGPTGGDGRDGGAGRDVPGPAAAAGNPPAPANRCEVRGL